MTLVELITVVMLMGVLGAIAAPRFFDNTAYAARGYADEVVSFVGYSQRIALASGCDVRVSIVAAGYAAEQRGEVGGTCAAVGAWSTPVLRSDGTPLTGAPPAGAAVAGNAVFVIDASDGSIRNGAPPPVSIGTYTITISQRTGAASVTSP